VEDWWIFPVCKGRASRRARSTTISINWQAPPDFAAWPDPRGQRLDMQNICDCIALIERIRQLELLDPLLCGRINQTNVRHRKEQEGPYPPSSVSTNDSNVSTLYGAGSLGAISLGANAITWSSIVIASFEYVRDANQTGSEGKRVNHLHSLPVHIGADLSKAW